MPRPTRYHIPCMVIVSKVECWCAEILHVYRCKNVHEAITVASAAYFDTTHQMRQIDEVELRVLKQDFNLWWEQEEEDTNPQHTGETYTVKYGIHICRTEQAFTITGVPNNAIQ